MYNLTNVTNQNNMVGIYQVANQITGGWFGILILVAIWIIAFIALKSYRTNAAFSAASFLAAVCSIFLTLLGLLSEMGIYITATLLALAVIAHFIEGSGQ
jgi:hypothetical protein